MLIASWFVDNMQRMLPFLLILLSSTDAFVILSSTKIRCATIPKRSRIVPSLRSTLRNNDVDEKLESSKIAVEALQDLLERQKYQVQDTERLLKRLTSPSENDDLSSILMAEDYGFVSRSEGALFSDLKGGFSSNEEYGPPPNIVKLGTQQFWRNLNAMRGEYEEDKINKEAMQLTPRKEELQAKLDKLTLNSTAIWERELANGPIEAPFLIKIPYLALCYLLDTVFEGRYVPSRFFLLETVARMPYFSYIAMLHFYETLGFWRRSSDVKRIHFAQELNEFRHLLIMESLGGDQAWWVRFLAQHSAIAYYVGLSLLFAASPTLSYRFSELLETHAVNTYGQFMDENEDLLKELPPTWVAVEYYMGASSDPFYAEFQLTKQEGTVSADEIEITNLYSVFENIQSDEAQHVGTMESCLDIEAALRSPSTEKSIIVGMAVLAVIGLALTSGNVEDASNTGVTDTLSGIDLSADAAVSVITNAIDAAAAGVAGIVGFTQQQQPLIDEDEEGNIVKIGTDMLESGAFAAIMGSIEKGVEVVLKLIRVFF
eukprot:scaffold98579_cov54-Attheya_sp.AAC.6